MTEFEEYQRLAEARISQQGRMLTKLRAAIRPFAEIPLETDEDPAGADMIMAVDMSIQASHVHAARKALESRGEDD